MDSHSIIAPSSAYIFGSPDGCTGWVMLSQMFPDIGENPEAADGEASHEIGGDLILQGSRGFTNIDPDNYVGKPASNGVIYNEEMFENAEIYANDVIDVMRSTGIFGGEHFAIEQRLEIKKIHDLSFGTPDMWLFDKKTGRLYIWDYKFGFDLVEVFENWQLINYVAGILELLEINGITDQHITVHMRVAQPRAFHPKGMIREWVVKASDLRGHFNILSTNAHIALSADAVCRSGPHCKNCHPRYACQTGLQAGMGLYELAMIPTPSDLPMQALGTQLLIVRRAIKQLEYLDSGLSTLVDFSVRSGKNVPGWIVEQKMGNNTWNKPIEEVIAMGDLMGKDLRKPNNVITPTQALKLGIDDKVIKEYSKRPNAGIKVVPDNENKVKQHFGAIEL